MSEVTFTPEQRDWIIDKFRQTRVFRIRDGMPSSNWFEKEIRDHTEYINRDFPEIRISESLENEVVAVSHYGDRRVDILRVKIEKGAKDE